MTRRMLINAQRPEELRIAIVRDHTLENFQVDVAESGLTRGNIYRGSIVNIQPSLNAAFIDYGTERHGFLAIQDVVEEAYYHSPRGGQPRIEEVLERGKPIVVQVSRDAIAQKGATLTTSLSLAGRYLVLTPFDDTRGVSRKVEDEETRKKLKALVANLELPPGCGVIVRTNALDQNKTAISRDLAALLRLWKKVQAAALDGKGSRLLYSDQDLIVQSLRDHLDSTIEEVLVDDDAAFNKAQAYIEAFLPRAKIRLERYEERLPLFSRFDLEPQIDRIYDRRVELPSGGSIVIDGTEALTAIDVNSGRSTRAATQEETAVHTNLEAATEVARQLWLRDIGGLVVVDFIDMRASKNQRRVEKALKDAMKADKARSSVGRISPNGLLEINRQRIQQALQVRTHRPCPTCAGTGRLASPELVTLNLLRRIEARAASGLVQGVRISLHPELADAMQNSRRQELADLEREFDLRIEVIAAAGLHRPEEQIEWFKRERPAAPKARPKPAAVVLEPWDLALSADQETGSPENGESGEGDAGEAAESRGRRERAASGPGRDAGDGAAAPEGRRGRQRRRDRGRGGQARPGRTAAAGGGPQAEREGRSGRPPRLPKAARPAPAAAGGGTTPEDPAPAGAHPAAGSARPVSGGAHGAHAADTAEEPEASRRGRKRRRGGRKRKRGGSAGVPAGAEPGTGAE
ncbi:MAG TPA: Rne/Rng family ribonuclease, partial [Thermoanaerobaculia bacterium]|nr:Rne/Rng family ribonuclease [Thermoanaerobaculia bacterium]